MSLHIACSASYHHNTRNWLKLLSEKRLRPVVLTQNVENLVVFVDKSTTFQVQQFLNADALN